ncbi:thioredoxin family protein [Bacillus sp. PAMC26568]|nr:thioredoxin family protein [Bacillus sp. PAMC26568]
MKKVMIFAAVFIVLFGALAFVTSYQQKEKAEGNPYGKDNLDAATVDQLDDPNYQDIILPEEVDEKIGKKEDFVVYYFSPTCEHCQRTTPVLMPVAEETGVEIGQFNLLEFEDGWRKYGITHTPTLVKYEDGKEVDRVEGYNDKAYFTDLLNKWKS